MPVVVGSVRLQRLLPTTNDPLVKVFLILARSEHHHIVVALEGHQLRLRPQSNQSVKDTLRIRPPIDVIAKRDNQIITLRRNLLKEQIERAKTAVDVTDY